MRRAVLALAAAAAALSLAGCGAAEVEVFTAEDAQAAARKTASAGTSRFGFTMTFEGIPELSEQRATLTGEGVFDHARERGQMTMDLSALLAPDEREFMQGTRFVMNRTDMYMRMPALDEIPGMKPWVEIAPVTHEGLNVEELYNELGANDPASMLRFVQTTGGDLERVGEQRLRGTQTTGYRGSMELRKVVDLVPPEKRDRMEEVVEMLEGVDLEEVPFEIWLDAENIVRRVTMEIHMEAGGDEADLTFTMDFWDFGIPVPVRVPPPADVMSEAEFDRVLEEAS